MNTCWQLWLQMFRRMPVLVVAANLLWLAAVACGICSFGDRNGTNVLCAVLFCMGSWFWHIGQGYSLRGLCVPESFLLPDFRRRLLQYAALDVVQWIALPAALGAWLQIPHLALVIGVCTFIAATGLMMGCNRRTSTLFWLVFVVIAWMPSLLATASKIAVQSALTPLLLIALAALIVQWSVRPLLRVTDRELDTSPLESTSLGRLQTRGVPGEARRTGTIGKRIAALFDHASQRAMTRALRVYQRHPTLGRRMILVRRLLLPHDNPEAIAPRIVLVAAFVGFYFFIVMHRPHYNAAALGAYAIMLAISRFPQLNVGMVRMRPNMADLYLTLAPQTRSEYQKIMSDALIVLVPISVLTALVYTLLGIVLAHAADPWRMLFVATIVATSGSLAALAIHLIGPEGTTGRTIINFVTVLGIMAVYWGGYWLVDTLGYVAGGSLLAIITLSFGIGAWVAARREYLGRAPRFDAPIG